MFRTQDFVPNAYHHHVQGYQGIGETHELTSIPNVNDLVNKDRNVSAYSSDYSMVHPLPAQESFPQKQTWWERHRTGWRFGVATGAGSVTLVFLINIICMIAALASGPVGAGGRVKLYDGSCSDIRPLNVGVHLLINVLSTVLLSASNYCMQCLSAPTRDEVDRAHGKSKWLDIGVPSIRNLSSINGARTLLWIALGASSFPLHLFYNSAVFSSIASNTYTVYTVNTAFTMGGEFNTTVASDRYMHDLAVNWTNSNDGSEAKARMDNLSSIDCVNAYANNFLSARANLLLIVDDPPNAPVENTTTPTIFYQRDIDSVDNEGDGCAVEIFGWVCNQISFDNCKDTCSNHLSQVRDFAKSTTWHPYISERPVKYCLSQKVDEHCKLQFSVHIATLVLILNASKLAVMMWLAFGIKADPLMTVGDAVSSFLRRPDHTTEGMCILPKPAFEPSSGRPWPLQGPREWKSTPSRWGKAASGKRWSLCISLFSGAIVLVASLLGYGISSIQGPKSASALFNLGIGAISTQAMITGWAIPGQGASGLIGNVIIANLAQPVLSFLYFTYNGVFTSMLLASEWNSYARKRKGLRVSGVHSGAQRSTYFLQLPYRYALPLMLVSGVLHWLVSQSIFLVSIESYSADSGDPATFEHQPSGDVMTCGYSPLGIILVLIVGVAMVLFAVFMGRRKFRASMPVAGSCSAAISAAVHPDKKEGRLWDMPVSWGVTSKPGENGSRVGHCSFSGAHVEAPEDGALYAGEVEVEVEVEGGEAPDKVRKRR